MKSMQPCVTLYSGNAAEARQQTAAGLALSTGRDVESVATAVLAAAGDSAKAQSLADDLAKRYPNDTLVQFVYLPTIRAQLSLDHKNTSKAIEALQTAVPYELGNDVGLYPVYVRGEAYLAAHQGTEAAGRVPENPRPSRNRTPTSRSERWRTFKSAERMFCKATPQKPRRRIRIFSRYGKTPTRKFQS